MDIWLDCFYLSDDLIAPGVLLKYILRHADPCMSMFLVLVE